MLKRVLDAVESAIDENGNLDDPEAMRVVEETVASVRDEYARKEFAKGFDSDAERALIEQHRDLWDPIISRVFQQLPLMPATRSIVHEYLAHSLARGFFDTSAHEMSSIAIAGFGSREHFPRLRAATIEARLGDRLKYRVDESQCVDITLKMGAAIAPFAQADAVMLFVEGADPSIKSLIFGYVHETLRQFPTRIVQKLALDSDTSKTVTEELRQVGEELYLEFIKRTTSQQRQHVDRLLGVVSSLPKDELAAAAEALVNLTSFRRRVFPDAETVGGPIDVALISKGDGLVWVRRKHYFKPELNHHFFQNYFLCADADSTDR